MCQGSICQFDHAVHQNGKHDVTPTGAPTTVQAFADLVQYHDCTSTYDIDNVHLSMASAQCQSCHIFDEFMGSHGADIRLRCTAMETALLAYFKAYDRADTVLRHLQASANSPIPTVMKATFELKRAFEGHSTKRLAGNFMARLGSRDPRAIRVDEYKALIEGLLEIFFPCTLPFDFVFLPVEARELGDCGIVTAKDRVGRYARYARIRLHLVIHSGRSCELPAKYRELNAASVDRLGTLLHERCHAFLDFYACCECSRVEIGQ